VLLARNIGASQSLWIGAQTRHCCWVIGNTAETESAFGVRRGQAYSKSGNATIY